MTTSPQYGPIPITVGVTGHRDVAPGSEMEIAAHVSRFLQKLREEHPHTRIEVLSALADGGDRIVARVAIELELDLIVPLPMPESEYLEDFDDTSKADFKTLLAQAKHFSVSNEREGSYRRLGSYIVRQSHVLIALWDGDDRDALPGGTAEVVRYKLQGDESQQRLKQLLDPADTGLVYHIVTPRVKHGLNPPLISSDWKFPRNYGTQDAAMEMFELLCRQTDEFNEETLTGQEDVVRWREESRRKLAEITAPLTIDEKTQTAIDVYAHADALARYFQRSTRITLRALFLSVFFALVAFEIFVHEFIKEHYVLFIYILLLSFALAAHYIAKWCRYQNKYLDFRALAEGLRVQIYWRLAGLSDTVAEQYVRHQRDELAWIRNALHYCEALPDAPAAQVNEGQGIRIAVNAWVKRQSDYFAQTLESEKIKLEKIHWQVRLLVTFGLIVTFVVLVRGLHPRPLTVLLMALPPAAAALRHGYAEKAALASHIKRYGRAAIVYRNAERRLNEEMASGNRPNAQDILRELGSEALSENAEWVILHRDRPLEVPQP